jgi:hypothetical protein
VVVSRLGLGLAALGRLAYNTLGRKRDLVAEALTTIVCRLAVAAST